MSYRNGSPVSASRVLLQPPHVKVRVALVCLVWGEEFADFFARYCIRSLLEPHNIPLVSREREVTLLLYTDRPTLEFLERCDSFNALSEFVQVEVLPLEQLPAVARTNHWVPWQHAVAGRNRDFDLFLVIIPDCVYAAGCLGTILDALREHDTVYYTLPQVCRETVTFELDGLRRVDGHAYISFTSRQAVELFIRHVNPKHAAAACSGAYFINHPEYAIELSPQRMVVSEAGSHPFAIKSSTRCVSYVLDARSPTAKACYLEILGVSAEPALKYVEEYYRWPKLHRGHSRAMNLGSWAWNFRDASSIAYSKSATHIALDQGRVLEQCRGQVTHAKTRFVNATLDYLAVASRVYERARQYPGATAAGYIALSIVAPGFHRHLRRLRSDLTVVLPKAGSRFEEVVEKIERHPAAQKMLRRFLFLHVVAGRLPILPGQAVFLTHSDTSDQFPKAFVIDPHAVGLGEGLLGQVMSPLQWVWEHVFCIDADIDYGHLTWAMLDPVHGASERVLDQLKAPDVAATSGEVTQRGPATVRRLEIKQALGRHVLALKRELALVMTRISHWRARAWLWLGRTYSGFTSPIFRFAKRRAPRLYEIARGGYRGLWPRVSAEPKLAASDSVRRSYDAISELNIIDNVAEVTRAFYGGLGLNPRQSPVYRCLASMRAALTKEVDASGPSSTGCSLERFELAWRAYAAGDIDEALALFREVIADGQLVQAGTADLRSQEAFVRAAEILGHHAELRGDADAADQLYRRILKFDRSGIVARRLLIMLWRQGRLREAAELAPRVMRSDGNLVLHLRGSDAVGDLTRRLKREARREPTTARGQNARDFGLQVG